MSRIDAGSGGGYVIDSYGMCGRANNFNGGCDTRNGADASYRLFMRAGETAATSLVRGSQTCLSSWLGNISLRIYQDTCSNCAACPTPTCSTQPYCSINNNQSTNFVAPTDGWYTFVVDTAGTGDYGGIFTLTIKLTCSGACAC